VSAATKPQREKLRSGAQSSRDDMFSGSKETQMALYVLALLLVFLVIYLFYAVIHPERF